MKFMMEILGRLRTGSRWLPVCLLAGWALTPATCAADLTNDVYAITLQGDGSAAVVVAGVTPKILRPEFKVLFRSTNPGFQYAEFPYPLWYVYGGTGERTNNPFLAGAKTTLLASQGQMIGGKLAWTFPAQPNFDLSAELSLGAGLQDPVITYTLTAKAAGWFMAAYSGAPELPPAQIEAVPQPATQYSTAPGYRFPDNPVLKQEHLCQLPMALLSSGAENCSLIVDPDYAPWRLAHQYNAIFGVGLRNEAGNAQPLVFAPMMGSATSQLTNSQSFTFALRFVVRPGYWSDTYRYMARSIYEFSDQRDNSGPGSINDVIANLVHYVTDKSGSNYAMWSDEQKFNDYFTDQPGAYKLLSPLYGIGAAILLDDEDFYRRRALPMIEYALSREKQTFFPFPTNDLGTVEANRNMNGPNIGSDALGVLYGLSQERSAAFRTYGLQKGVVRAYTRFDDVLEFYRLTGDAADLAYAIAGADYCLANNLIGQDYMAWLEMFKETGDSNYLAAANLAVRNYEPDLNVSPRIPAANILVDTNNQAPIHWQSTGRHLQWGFPPPEPMYAPEQSVPAWRPALTGLRPESYRGFTFVHYAAGMLRLSRHLNDDFTRDLARWALVGRWGNFPGEIFSRDYSLVYEQSNYCEHPLQYMTFTSMHFGHPWMYLAWALDFLVSDTFHRSNMEIDFPSRPVRGSFPCNVYGDRPGRFYDETNVNLWLPVGLLSVSNRQVNYLSAYGNGKLYLAIVNQSFNAETTTITLNSNLVNFGASHPVRVWVENASQPSINVTNGSLTVQVAAKGITALAIEGINVQTRLQQKMFDPAAVSTPPASLVRKSGPYGKLVGLLISMGRDLAEAYVYTDALPEEITKAKLRYDVGGGWTEKEDLCFPYEFSIPVSHTNPAMQCEFFGTLTNGQEVLMGTLTLPGDPNIYMDASAAPGGDGTSWATAVNDINSALATAFAGNQIWVRSGEYVLTNTLTLASGLQLYGGFAGTETNLAQRTGINSANETILRQTTPGLRVVDINSNSNIRLDGFTLTGATNVSGGGAGLRLFHVPASVVVANCRITGNSDSAVDGAGAGIRLTASTPTMINCEISGNYGPRTGSTGGGGIYFDATSGGFWTNCVVAANRTEGDNGAGANVQCGDGYGPMFVGCDFINNESGKNGGGVYGKGDFSFINCSFAGNQVRTPTGNSAGGGGLFAYNTGSDVLLENCIVSGNRVGTSAEAGAGGGVFVSTVQSFVMRNSIISGNSLTGSSLSRGAGVHVASSANITNVTVNNCTIADNDQLVTTTAGGFNNVNATAGTVFLRNTILAGNSQLARSGTITENSNLYFGNGTDGVPVGDPKFVHATTNAIAGTWVAVDAFNPAPLSGRGTTILTANGSPFVPDALAGRLINPKAGQKRQAYILANTANTVTVVGDMAGDVGVSPGDAFAVMDYQLTPGSAAIDAGNALTATLQDINGTSRNGAPDAGAFEFGAGEDHSPPTVMLTAANITQGGASTHNLIVTYSDSTAVDVAFIASNDLRVTGPNAFDQLATLVSVNLSSNGTPRVATYQIVAPGGAWNWDDNGTYSVALEPDRIRDTQGNITPAGTLGVFDVVIPPPPGNFEHRFDFSLATGDRDRNFGERQPGNTFDVNSGSTNLIVTSGGYLTASTAAKAWIILNDTSPDTLDAGPTNANSLKAGTNLIVRTRIENLTSGTGNEDISGGILFGLTSLGSGASGFLARVDRGIGTSQVYLDQFANGMRVANLATGVSGFSWGANTTPYFLELRISSDGPTTNAVLKVFSDAAIPGTGGDSARLVDAAFDTQTNLASVSVALTNYAGGFLGLYVEDNSSTNASNPSLGNIRFSNFYSRSSQAEAAAHVPMITGLRVTGGNVEIDFAGDNGDAASAFRLLSASALTESFVAVAPPANISGLGSGNFRATTPLAGNVRFYRIERIVQ